MSTSLVFDPQVLEIIPGESSTGVNLRFTAEWKLLEEAKREDDGFNKGAWELKEQKTADWQTVGELAENLLARRSKDLRLAVLLTEARIRRQKRFAAVAPCFVMLRELAARYWDAGLYPEPDGESYEDRAAAFYWLNEKLPDLLCSQAITDGRSSGSLATFSYAQYIDALDAKKSGRGSSLLEEYHAAVAASSREYYQPVGEALRSAHSEVLALSKILNEKFGSAEAAPGFKQLRETIEELIDHVESHLAKKRAQEPDPSGAEQTSNDGFRSPNAGIAGLASSVSSNGTDWANAESLIRSGQIEKGIAEMTLLAQRETSGRARFQRKLLLADVAVKLNKDYLGRTILEELAEQIDSFKLVEWETTEVVGAVWTRLYRLHKRLGNEDRAQQFYLRLCRVDPWQALACSEG